VADPVVARPLVLVRESLFRLDQTPGPLARVLVVTDVGMCLLEFLPVGLLDLRLGGVRCDAQQLVVALSHG
jgi:hypothetical protein